jgi:hypothetical protein
LSIALTVVAIIATDAIAQRRAVDPPERLSIGVRCSISAAETSYVSLLIAQRMYP